MRTTVRRRLIDAVPSVQVLDETEDIDYALSRVFEPHGATEETPFPFIVFGEADVDPTQATSPSSTDLEAHPYVDRETFRLLDEMHAQIRDKFDWKVFTHDDKPYLSELLAAGDDVLDGRWGGLTKPVRFQVFDLSMFITETFEPDPIAGLRSWAVAQWPPQGEDLVTQIQTDATTWEPSNDAPGILFRLQGIPTMLEQWNSVSWLRATLRAHVIAPDRATRLEWTRRLTEALSVARSVALGDGSYFYLESIAADASLHAVRDGQISVQGRYGVLIPHDTAEPLTELNLTEAPTP